MDADGFVALDAWFACRSADPAAPPSVPATPPACENESSGDAAAARALAESARWYARLNDALDAACARLIREVAAGVLARELQLAPCEIAAIVANVRAQMLGEPLCMRLHPEDAARWHDASLPCRRDSTLAPGDALIELREGSIDARFGVRLQRVLDACTP